MAGFDAKTYKSGVLKPYSKGEGFEQLREVLQALARDPADGSYSRLELNQLYAVPNPVKADELKAWKTSITSTLNKSMGMFPAAKLLGQLLTHIEQQGKDLTDPAFWGSLQAERQKLTIAALEQGVDQLRHEYPLGVITLEELTARLAAIGVTGVTEGSIRSVAENKGFAIYPEFELPSRDMPSPGLVNSWKSLANDSAYRSVLDVLLLHDTARINDVTFIDQLSAAGAVFGVRDIHAAHEKADKSKDTNDIQLAKKFLSVVKGEINDDVKLREIIMIAMVQLVTTRLGRGQPIVGVRDNLVSRGVSKVDAARLVTAIDTEANAGGSGSKIGLEQVRELLGRGQLAEAERTHAAIIVEDDEADAYRQLGLRVADLNQQKTDALDRYQTAMSARDLQSASKAIAEAIAIDAADDALIALRDAVPPAAPSSLQVLIKDSTVELNWAQTADTAISYTVVRAEGRLPAAVTDGTSLGNNLSISSFVDTNPPVGSRAGYAVFGTRDGQVYSDAAAAEIMVLQRPTGLQAETQTDSTQLSWNMPASASGVVITQQNPNGSQAETEVLRGTIFQVDGLRTGERYRFSIRTIYLLDSGRHLSEPSAITVLPRGVAKGVNDLQIESVGESDTELQATWGAVEGFEIELWQFPRTSEVAQGTTVDAANLGKLGAKRLTVVPRDIGGGVMVARLPQIPEVVKIFPITVTESGGLIGHSVIAGSAEQVSNIVTEVFGEELRLSWDWPSGDYLIELSWRDDGKPRTRRVTRSRYRAEGGSVLANAARITNLGIATVIRVDDDEWVSAAVPAPTASRVGTPTANYRIQMKKALFGGKVTCHIEATTPEPGFTMPVDVVLKHGSIMPFSADDGSRIEHLVFDFSTSAASNHIVEIGKRSSPFWVCLFASQADHQLTPPPTSELKG